MAAARRPCVIADNPQWSIVRALHDSSKSLVLNAEGDGRECLLSGGLVQSANLVPMGGATHDLAYQQESVDHRTDRSRPLLFRTLRPKQSIAKSDPSRIEI